MESADAGIKVIIAITEGIPVKDMMKAKDYIQDKGVILVGPNCPGVLLLERQKWVLCLALSLNQVGFGVVSKSGTLTYEAADQVVKAGLGISTAIE